MTVVSPVKVNGGMPVLMATGCGMGGGRIGAGKALPTVTGSPVIWNAPEMFGVMLAGDDELVFCDLITLIKFAAAETWTALSVPRAGSNRLIEGLKDEMK